MSKKLYIISETFQPNTAPVNRFLAFAKGYGELGVDVKAVFVFPSKDYDRVKVHYKNVKFIYFFGRLKINNRYLRYLQSLINLCLFWLKLSRKDIVILYGMIHFLWIFRLKKNITLYHERTESPEVVGRSYSLLGNFKHNLYLKTCKKLEGLFVISPSLQEYFIRDVGVNEEKVYIINMIVDLSRFVNIDIKSHSNTIAYCGTISERKDGISYLLKAFSIVVERYNDFTLDLIGAFESLETEKNVRDLIKLLNIDRKVILRGSVSAEEMPVLLCKAKILALSRPNNKQAQFGFPTKLGEYLMTGNPVVITQVGDFDKYFENKKNVIFSRPNEVIDFADKLLWTIDNYEQAQIIGLKGKQVAMRSFNYKVESQKVVRIIFENKCNNI